MNSMTARSPRKSDNPTNLLESISWRIKTPDAGFFTRSTVQKFAQDPKYPGILYNHDNEFLHYQDDWYILSSKIEYQLDDYIFVYYRGSRCMGRIWWRCGVYQKFSFAQKDCTSTTKGCSKCRTRFQHIYQNRQYVWTRTTPHQETGKNG